MDHCLVRLTIKDRKRGLIPVIHKIQIEITHYSERNATSIDCRRSSIGSSCAQIDIFNKLKCKKKVASSTDSIVSGQVEVAGTKPINLQTAPSTQLQGNLIHEPEIEKKGGRTPVGGKAISTNTSVVANQNQSQDQQRRQPGGSSWTVPTHGNSEQNKG
ncbi:MAG: hypothetical protein EZS28_048854 [Streblomastix strix]|uniref:Uncharacterized protein n=1 Tax=Streblomastix strix TaxID=222440 RepID=A0A5J4TBT7_9EUKA|nr:MAG: hypothetical protein EZS28_048854 [Streblomastix strix]